jgi:1-acyl-sn-glycerol-3-phosphate acyltransferase
LTTLLRRAVSLPVVTILIAAMWAASPLLMAAACLGSLAARSSRPVRTVALALAYTWIELRTVTKFACGQRDCDQLMREFLATAYTAVRRILRVEVILDPVSVTPPMIPRDEPLIVLSRHCGPGDSVLVAWLLAVRYRLQLRIVLKAVLRCEPVLDIAGQLGGLCFLGRGDRAREQVYELASSLRGGQALLLFPEGANFTWSRWRDAIHELHATGEVRAAVRALGQSHTLPPRTGGAIAAVTGAPTANLLVLTHNGFCPDGRARPWWQLPIHRQLLVRTSLVPAAHVPSAAELNPWLERTWSQVDAWVAAHSDDSP